MLTAGTVDVHVDGFLAGLGLEKEELRDHQRRDVVVHGAHEADDAVLEQARVDVVAALAPAGLLDDDGHEGRVRRGSPGRATPDRVWKEERMRSPNAESESSFVRFACSPCCHLECRLVAPSDASSSKWIENKTHVL